MTSQVPVTPDVPVAPDFGLGDDDLRAAGRLKWSVHPSDVLPAWVADMDVRPAPVVLRALHDAVDRGMTTYPPPPSALGVREAFAQFQAERFADTVDPHRVVLVGDVMGGVELVLDVLCEPGPVAVPVPNYGPFFHLAGLLHRAVVAVPHAPDAAGRPTLDLEALAGAFRGGARTLLLSQPQNPLGRCFDRAELTALIGVAREHGARVVSDEIWGPLTLDEGAYVPMASLDGAEGCVTAVTGSAKSWNVAGLKSALVVTTSQADRAALLGLPHVGNHGSSVLGVVAARAAYAEGRPWLDGLLAHLRSARDRLRSRVDELLPGVRMQAPEATFLAWLDTSALGLDDPAGLALSRGRVALLPGDYFAPGASYGADWARTHVRLNFGTSLERIDRLVAGLARAWYP